MTTNQFDAINRASHAERLLAEPLIKEAFRAVESGLVDALKRSEIGDESTHHNLAISLQLLSNVERQFNNWIRDGQLEAVKEKQRKSWRDSLRLGA